MRRIRLVYLYFMLPVILISVIGATRNLMLHGDTPRYAKLFEYTVQNGEYPYWEEPLFALLVLLIVNVTTSVRVYFGFIVALVLILNLRIINHLIKLDLNQHNISQHSQVMVALSCLVMSGWFYAGSVNGLKQYISILVLTLGILSWWGGQNIISAILLISAPLLHVSSILFLPIIFLRNSGTKFVTCLFLLFAIGYPLGVNETLLQIFSDLLTAFGIPNIYTLLISYNDYDQNFRGFVPEFFVYTVFHYILLLFCYFSSRKQDNRLLYLLRIYAGLSIVYFIFGVGAWTNRLAFPAWSLIPFVYSIVYFKLADDFAFFPRITLPLLPFGALFIYSWRIYV